MTGPEGVVVRVVSVSGAKPLGCFRPHNAVALPFKMERLSKLGRIFSSLAAVQGLLEY